MAVWQQQGGVDNVCVSLQDCPADPGRAVPQAQGAVRCPGENSTVWDSPSPKFIMGGSDEKKYDHATQKPVDLMRRPILNHLRRGELVYDPFLGSGTTLSAA